MKSFSGEADVCLTTVLLRKANIQCVSGNQSSHSETLLSVVLHSLEVTLLNLCKLTVVTASIAVQFCESEHVGKLTS